jgi:hypothetical protein
VSSKNLTLWDDINIVDITNQSYQLNKNIRLVKYPKSIPYWGYFDNLVYSDLEKASPQQKNFYAIFKESFLKNQYYNLDYSGKNYVQILVFDFIREYHADNDIQKLNQHFAVIKKLYDIATSICNFFLKEIVIKIGDEKRLANHLKAIRLDYDFKSLNNEEWDLGYRYQIKLDLSDAEVVHLNNLDFQENSFNTIEPFQEEILKLYLKTLYALKKSFQQDNTTIDIAFNIVADLIARKNFRFRNGSRNYFNSIQQSQYDFLQYILKSCENEVRKKYIVKTKIIKGSTLFHVEAKKVFDSLIVQKVAAVIEPLIQDIEDIDPKYEVELNTINPTRWKIIFENLKNSFNGDIKTFSEGIQQLININPNNPSIENLYLEASKYIVTHNKELALAFYIKYIDQNRKTDLHKLKALPKTFNKILFSDKKQQAQFEAIVASYSADKNLENALQQIPKIYAIVRKKIKIDTETVKDVQKAHAETVELLEEYLKDDLEETIHPPIITKAVKEKSTSKAAKDAKVEKVDKPEKVEKPITHIISKFISTLHFNEIDIKLLDLMEKNNFSILQSDVEKFAKSNGVFKNQLIEHINDSCFDTLDDVLIEEEDQHYTINKQYFSKITVQ